MGDYYIGLIKGDKRNLDYSADVSWWPWATRQRLGFGRFRPATR